MSGVASRGAQLEATARWSRHARVPAVHGWVGTVTSPPPQWGSVDSLVNAGPPPARPARHPCTIFVQSLYNLCRIFGLPSGTPPCRIFWVRSDPEIHDGGELTGQRWGKDGRAMYKDGAKMVQRLGPQGERQPSINSHVIIGAAPGVDCALPRGLDIVTESRYMTRLSYDIIT